MKDYSKGKIYKIWSPSTDNIYIGSTCEPILSRRLVKHRTDYKRYQDGNFCYVTSFDILKLGDYRIELIEMVNCSCNDELLAREGHHIRENKDVCVNKRIEGRTNKQYYDDNKEQKKEQQKEYRQNNKDMIKQKQSEKKICGCGSTYTLSNKARHEKSLKHQNFIKATHQ